jgi:hypothetical protein
VTNQTRFSMMAASAREADLNAQAVAPDAPAGLRPERQLAALRFNLNTCHVWDEDGEHVRALENGETGEVPVWITKRYAKVGRDATDWRTFTR